MSKSKDMYAWGVRAGYEGVGPKALHESWYFKENIKAFAQGRIKGQELRMEALLTNEPIKIRDRWEL